MNSFGLPVLSLLLWLPLVGALVLLMVPGGRAQLVRAVTLTTTLGTAGLAALVVGLFYSGPYGPLAGDVVGAPLQFVERISWLPGVGAQYLLGVDGLNLWLIALTALLGPLVVIAGWGRSVANARLFSVLLLAAETSFLGVFLAQDMLLFYVFFELALIPIVFLIGMWGSHGRTAAALKLFLYTFSGSLLMLAGIIALHVLHRNAISASDAIFRGTFELSRIAADLRSGVFSLDPLAARLIFGAFFAAFAVKLALWPFHTWLPDAYSAAPLPVAVLLAGVMAKFGVYGMLRFNLQLFPEVTAWAAPAIGVLAVIGVLYGALIAFTQQDTLRMIGYASISHMNLVVLGVLSLTALGLSGALFQLFAHGITTAALLLIVAVINDRRDTRELGTIGGLWHVTPVYAGLTLVTLLALAGLPGLSGFIGEFAVLQGVFSSAVLGWPYAAAAALGMILTAAYALRLFRSGFMGPVQNSVNQTLTDLTLRERISLGGLVAAMVLIGLFPNLLLSGIESTVQSVAAIYEPFSLAVSSFGGR
jgi:NADH-quinone oxidoreductase subunit M